MLGATRLAGRPEVGDDVAAQRGEGGHRRHVVAELRVVVVLDHQGARSPRRPEQGEPVGPGHHRPERMLVGGGDVRRGAAVEVGHGLRRREVADRSTAGPDRLGGRAVARVLVPDGARRKSGEDLGEPADGARRHQDLVGVAGEAPGAGEVTRQLYAKVPQAGRVVVAPGWGGGRDVAPGTSPGRAVARVDPRRAGVEPHQPGLGGGAGPRGGPSRGGTGGDVGPGAAPALHPALGAELVVGLLGHAARDAELGGQRARARQPRGPTGACRRRPGRGLPRRAGARAGTPEPRSSTSGTGLLRGI